MSYSLWSTFAPTNPFCVSQILWRSYDCHIVEVNLVTLALWDTTEFKIVVSACFSDLDVVIDANF